MVFGGVNAGCCCCFVLFFSTSNPDLLIFELFIFLHEIPHLYTEFVAICSWNIQPIWTNLTLAWEPISLFYKVTTWCSFFIHILVLCSNTSLIGLNQILVAYGSSSVSDMSWGVYLYLILILICLLVPQQPANRSGSQKDVATFYNICTIRTNLSP